MLIIDKYDSEKNIDECWYNSSNIVYSKCHDKPNDYKDLEVVFSDGRRYKYLEMNIQDVLLFKVAESQGKALSKFIKKYQFERMEKVDLAELQAKKMLLLEEKNNLNTK